MTQVHSFPSAGAPKVQILMGTYNGADFLDAQLQSFRAQTHKAWELQVRDDGSRDTTVQVLQAFTRQTNAPMQLHTGETMGFSANYMSLIKGLVHSTDCVAFSDQDDIWEPEKLARAVAALGECPSERPALYCARRWYWQSGGDKRQASPRQERAPSFRNALIENMAAGNTIVLNGAAARLAAQAAQRGGVPFAHDWWLYLLVIGAGGQVICDNGPPCLLYRQHARNVLGSGAGMVAQIKRKLLVLQGAFGERLQSNISEMERVQDLLTPENRAVLEQFRRARAAGLMARIKGLRALGLYRQSRMGTLGFWGAALLGRI